MAHDPTEGLRRVMVEVLNADADPERAAMEAKHGQVWNTAELQEQFDVISFLAPFVLVRRKSDGAEGTMAFTHSPRWYFRFEPTKG